MVKQPAKVLSGANSVQLGSSNKRQNLPYLGANQAIVDHQSAKRNSFKRKSVFDRLSFPRISVFDRISWNDDQVSRHEQCLSNGEEPQWTEAGDNLNLNLSLGLSNPASSLNKVSNDSSLGTVRCRRCLSHSHTRRECRFPIKCQTCGVWGHVAASCGSQWKQMQSLLKERPLDNFSRQFDGHIDCSGWFKGPQSMTAGPSSPPKFLSFVDFSGVPPTSCTIHWRREAFSSSTSALYSCATTTNPWQSTTLALC